MWASAVVACAVVVSAGLLRRWPLLALALLVVIPVVASTMDAMRLGLGLLVLFYAAAGIEVCFIAATRSRRISLVAALMVLAVPAVFLGERLQMPVQLDVVVLLTTVIAWLAGHSVRQAALQAGLVFPSDGPPHEPRADSRENKLGAAVPLGAPCSS